MVLVLSVRTNVANISRNDTVTEQVLLTLLDPTESQVGGDCFFRSRRIVAPKAAGDLTVSLSPACIPFISVRVSR